MLVRSEIVFVVFFFSSRRRHTRFDCDWSSDVCSSDLRLPRESAETIREIAQQCLARGFHEHDPFVELVLSHFYGAAVCRDLHDVTLAIVRSEEHTSELQSQSNLVCRLLLEKKKYPTDKGLHLGREENPIPRLPSVTCSCDPVPCGRHRRLTLPARTLQQRWDHVPKLLPVAE